MKKSFNLFVALLLGLVVNAQIPAGYYYGTDGLSGQQLKTRLHQIIRNHKVYTYSQIKDVLKDLDEDPNNSDNIIMFYKNNSIPKADFANGNDSWNREHTWPKSHGFSSESDTAYTDVYNLRPADASVNNSKSNKDFNDVAHIAANEEGDAPNTYTDSYYWEPRDEIKGDVARILMYMDTRYESSRLDLELVDRRTFSGDPELGVLYTILRWHMLDPVDDEERARHEGAFGYQQNRNPFIDHPEFATAIWGDVTNPFVAFDKTSFNFDFGAVRFGESYTQSYTINAYNLESDLNVSVSAPFYLSKDNVSYTGSISFSHSENTTNESYKVYVKFEPSSVTGLSYNQSIKHESSNLPTTNLEITGQEGEASMITIAQARTKSLNSVVTVTGVVLGGENNSSTSRVLFDGTAGIVIRSPDGATNQTSLLKLGDSVVVSGALTEYSNLLQINGAPMDVTFIKSGVKLPEPKELTISEIGEKYESQLVIIREVLFADAGKKFAGGGTDGNFDITDATGTLVLRIGNSGHPLVGTTIPSGRYDVVGYIGQFADDYQISPRNVNDIKPIVKEPEDLLLSDISLAREKTENDVVKVAGVVIGGPNNNASNRIIYDGTAGIVVRGTDLGNLSSDLILGDSVVVTGGIFNYNGLLEILNSPVTIELKAQGISLPMPQEITLSELGESVESELVLIKNVSISTSGKFATGNYEISDNSGTSVLRIGSVSNTIVNTSIPSATFDLVGYVGQDEDEYQIFVNGVDDISNILILQSGDVIQKLDLVYPNPANQLMNLNVSGSNELEVSLFDYSGKLHLHQYSSDRKINVSSVKSGLYIVVVSEGEKTYYSRVIKQ